MLLFIKIISPRFSIKLYSFDFASISLTTSLQAKISPRSEENRRKLETSIFFFSRRVFTRFAGPRYRSVTPTHDNASAERIAEQKYSTGRKIGTFVVSTSQIPRRSGKKSLEWCVTGRPGSSVQCKIFARASDQAAPSVKRFHAFFLPSPSESNFF